MFLTKNKLNFSTLVSGWKSLGLSAGIGCLLASSGAIAFLHPAVAQSTPTPKDVEVETQTGGTSPTNSGSGNGGTVNNSNVRFGCQQINGEYTVVYYPKSQPGQAYPWAIPSNMGAGWTPERRCNEIARRLEVYRPEGLQEMQTSIENNYNIVCVTTQKNPNTCQIVFTVPPGQDPQSTRDRVFQNLTVADSGQTTQGVNTFTGNGRESDVLNRVLGNIGLSSLGNNRSFTNGINLRPFLDSADGGTGARLTGGLRTRNNARPNPRLNPGSFR